MENPAAVMSATTAGRRLERILLIAEVSLYLQYMYAIYYQTNLEYSIV